MSQRTQSETAEYMIELVQKRLAQIQSFVEQEKEKKDTISWPEIGDLGYIARHLLEIVYVLQSKE